MSNIIEFPVPASGLAEERRALERERDDIERALVSAAARAKEITVLLGDGGEWTRSP